MRLIITLLCLPAFIFSQPILLKNVTVIPMNQEVRFKNCNVFINNGLIEKIDGFPSKASVKGYKVIDCTGKFVIPGLADMHAHFPGTDDPIQVQEYLRLNLAAGVTLLRSMRGKSYQLAVRDSVNKGLKKNSPAMLVSYVFPYRDSLLNKDSIDRIIRYAKNSHYDFIKYLGGINAVNFNLMAESCRENNIPLAGHAYGGGLEKYIDAGYVSIEHYQPVLSAYDKDSLNFQKKLDAMKANHVAFCPTLSFYYIISSAFSEQALLARNGMNYVSQKVKDAWLKEYNESLTDTKNRMKEEFESKYILMYKQQLTKFNKILKTMVDAGLIVVLSPDDATFNVPGFSMYEEMRLYKNAGLSNYQVLKCATYNAALCLKTQATSGSVEVGKKADLLLLNADPLENIDNIKQVEGTFLNGKYYTQKELLKAN